jgi:hypothetical protein
VHGDKWGGMGGARVEDYCIMVHVMILQAGRQAGRQESQDRTRRFTACFTH